MADTNSPDLIQRMADELDRYRQIATDDRRSTHPLSDEARAYLAQSEPDDSSAFIAWILFDPDGKLRPEAQEVLAARGITQPKPQVPTDEEILALSHEYEVSYTMRDGHVIYPKQEGCDMRDDVLSFARAVLAHWGK